jgi:hypothetical protein
MILPGKHIRQDRALLVVGGDILSILDAPMSVSELWNRVRRLRETKDDSPPLSFDWFVLALTFLFAVSAVSRNEDDLIYPRTAI